MSVLMSPIDLTDLEYRIAAYYGRSCNPHVERIFKDLTTWCRTPQSLASIGAKHVNTVFDASVRRWKTTLAKGKPKTSGSMCLISQYIGMPCSQSGSAVADVNDVLNSTAVIVTP